MMAFVPVFFFASVYAQVSLSAWPNQAALYLLYFFIGFGWPPSGAAGSWTSAVPVPALKLGTALGAVGFVLWAGKLTTLSMHDQWLYAAMAGAGIGLLLAPASTDAVNRAIGASTARSPGSPRPVRESGEHRTGGVRHGADATGRSPRWRDAAGQGCAGRVRRGCAESVAQAVTGQGDSRAVR